MRDLDADGIAAEVLFHGGLNWQSIPFTRSSMFSWSSAAYSHLESAGVRIYNRWLADFVSAAPERFVGLAHLPIPDIEACVREVEWARANGLTAVNLPAPRREFADYNDPIWEPLWSACAANEMVMSTHGAGGDVHPYKGREASAIGLLELPFFARRATWILIMSGVFERHPTLKLVTAEQFGDWVPETLRDMDSAFKSFLVPQDPPILPELPSEYWRRNCFVGASFMSHDEAELACAQGLQGNFMWGADYPHPEGTWPRTTASLRATFAGIEESDVRALIGQTAAHVYGFDMTKLHDLAQRIGPSVEQVAQPLEEVPDTFVGFAFRTKGKFS
jgi:predicted TIM-barrel fold metal-dependent hydrolase